jgi:hypothetical protein
MHNISHENQISTKTLEILETEKQKFSRSTPVTYNVKYSPCQNSGPFERLIILFDF